VRFINVLIYSNLKSKKRGNYYIY